MKPDFLTFAMFCAVITLTACSSPAPETKKADSESAAKKEPEAPPKPVSAKTAFWEVYKPAHTWAADLQPIGVKSEEVEGMPNDSGLAWRWTIAFVSPSRHEVRTYDYSVVNQPPSVVRGVKAENALPWAGPSADAMPFTTGDFSIDSEAAFKTAADKADKWLLKHPGKQASLTLGNATRYTAPMWYILWGDKKDGFAAYVNASTGTYGAK